MDIKWLGPCDWLKEWSIASQKSKGMAHKLSNKTWSCAIGLPTSFKLSYYIVMFSISGSALEKNE